MVLVLFFGIMLFLLIILVMFTLFSTIKIKIQGIETSNIKKMKSKYIISFTVNLLNKFKWLSIDLDDTKIKKISKKMHLEKINIQKLEKNIKLSNIKELINIKPRISFLNLYVNIGLEDVIITSYLVAGISTILGLIMPYLTNENNIKNINYKISPVYNNQNIYYIKLDTVLEIKVINVLNAAYKNYKNKEDNKLASRFA